MTDSQTGDTSNNAPRIKVMPSKVWLPWDVDPVVVEGILGCRLRGGTFGLGRLYEYEVEEIGNEVDSGRR